MIFDVYKLNPHSFPGIFNIYYLIFRMIQTISRLVTSFANTNVCLVIIYGKKINDRADQVKYTEI